MRRLKISGLMLVMLALGLVLGASGSGFSNPSYPIVVLVNVEVYECYIGWMVGPPIPNAKVEVIDTWDSPPTVVAWGYTDDSGKYTTTVTFYIPEGWDPVQTANSIIGVKAEKPGYGPSQEIWRFFVPGGPPPLPDVIGNIAICLPSTNQPPQASFTYSHALPEPSWGERVKFVSQSTDPDGDDDIVSYHWIFGDGETGRGKVVTHVYERAGGYTVTLVVTDRAGATNRTSQGIMIPLKPENLQPGDLIFVEHGNPLLPLTIDHVGIVGRRGDIINARRPVVVSESWDRFWQHYDGERFTWGQMRVNTSAQVANRAVDFAYRQLGLPYEALHLMLIKEPNGTRWYCSELVWAAYLNASASTPTLINLDSGDPEDAPPTTNWVSPDEIFLSRWTRLLRGNVHPQ